ncbi:MAG: hypothetical protein HWE20_13680 [Gammaproteobacteria bacterium]|nr:hypothetical protein [Gammaproteobacteria bacterium]
MDRVEHFYGIVPVRWIADEPRFLMLRSYHIWTFPRYTLDNASAEAVGEALSSEFALNEIDFRLGTECRSTRPYSRGYVDHYYLVFNEFGEPQLPYSPISNSPVWDEFRWLRHRDARAKLRAPIRPIVDWAYETAVELTKPKESRKVLRTHFGIGLRRRRDATPSD